MILFGGVVITVTGKYESNYFYYSHAYDYYAH